MAMVAIGPTPGSTPISVPTRQPMKAEREVGRRQRGGKAEPEIADEVEHGAPSVAEEPRRERDRQPERKLEQADAERRHQRAEQERLPPAHLVAGECGRSRWRAGRRRRGRADAPSGRTPRGAEHQDAAPASTSARAAVRLPGRSRRRAARRASRAAPPVPSAACPAPCRRAFRIGRGALPERESCNGDDDQPADEILPRQQRGLRSQWICILRTHGRPP